MTAAPLPALCLVLSGAATALVYRRALERDRTGGPLRVGEVLGDLLGQPSPATPFPAPRPSHDRSSPVTDIARRRRDPMAGAPRLAEQDRPDPDRARAARAAAPDEHPWVRSAIPESERRR